MADDDSTELSRRKLIAGTGAAAGTLLAGCTSGGSGTNGNDGGTTTGDGTTKSGGPYSVSIEPMGSVEFESVPKTWVANNGSWADMGVALGLEPPKGMWMTSRYYTRYYDEIPGVSVDKSGMVSLYQDGVSKERFYSLDGDVHVIDPNFLQNRFKGWKQSDVDEIRKNIGPFFGNSIFSRGYEWHKDYRYYTLYQAFGKLAKVFQRTDRYDAFSSLHDTFQSKLDSVVPPKKKRPSVAVLWASSNKPETFLPYLIDEGTSFKQWRDLKVKDALANTSVKNFHSGRGKVDYETLLQVDPDVLLLRGHEQKTEEKFQNTVVSSMKNHNVGSKLTAVKNGDVYRGGPLYQGPITNLVLTERAAKQLYGASGKLFDRKRVANIVNGEF
ncbi:ABC transporter substrate-binding protein [Halomicrococcus sp. NG-SE-24]|uniref:ABC transporter substrate-binding protein n=1 Tax=Halomicrococcus sp. NG-SE-24 TaxID=3436928 RepID=UPI003D951A8E